MKSLLKMVMVMVVCVMMFGCATTNNKPSNATMGGVTGGVLGGIAHAIIGGDTTQGLAIVGASALGGYIVGNEIDKTDVYNNQQQIIQQQQTITSLPVNNSQTECRKVIKREWKNGVMVETKSEVCNAIKTDNFYYE